MCFLSTRTYYHCLTNASEKADDGKSYVNPPAAHDSEAYESFTSPVLNDSRGGFDIHIYFLQTSEYETKYASELWERIRREFPELRIYKLWDKPIGPHPIAMFEVNVGSKCSCWSISVWLSTSQVFTPRQFGAFIPWLVINRGPLSALIHPNTGNDYRDHSQRATWMGQPIPLDLRGLKEALSKKEGH